MIHYGQESTWRFQDGTTECLEKLSHPRYRFSLIVFHIEMSEASDNLSANISMDGSVCHDGE